MGPESQSRLDAVCFDLDGVLIDSEQAWDAARRAVVAESGGHWAPKATRTMMGMSAAEWSRYLAGELKVPLDPAEISDRVVAKLVVAIPDREFLPDAEALARADLVLDSLDELLPDALLTPGSHSARAQA